MKFILGFKIYKNNENIELGYDSEIIRHLTPKRNRKI